MTQANEKLVGKQRDDALSDLKASLSVYAELPDILPNSLEGTLAHILTSHPDRELYLEVHGKLFDFITLASDVFSKDPYSPTPGDPERAVLDDSMYSDEALMYMYDIVTQVKSRLEKGERFGRSSTLTDDELHTIRREIALQHDHEIEKNAAAFDRLREKFTNDPSSISPGEADLIEKVRGVSASSIERVELLALHPEIDAIEDMKLTCVMDYTAYADAMSEYRNRLWALNDEERFTVLLVPSDQQSSRPRDLSGIAPDEVRADKTVIAEVYDSQTGLVFEAVEKTNWYAFDAARTFEGTLPHVIDGINEQPLYTQVYLRVKHDRSEEGSLQEQERQYNLQHIYIRDGDEKKYIENL